MNHTLVEIGCSFLFSAGVGLGICFAGKRYIDRQQAEIKKFLGSRMLALSLKVNDISAQMRSGLDAGRKDILSNLDGSVDTVLGAFEVLDKTLMEAIDDLGLQLGGVHESVVAQTTSFQEFGGEIRRYAKQIIDARQQQAQNYVPLRSVCTVCGRDVYKFEVKENDKTVCLDCIANGRWTAPTQPRPKTLRGNS